MSLRSVPLVAVMLFGCSEYDLGGPVGPHPPGQAPDGLGDPWMEDEVVQVVVPQTDVLFVLDNSSSMDAERDEVLQNMPLFMSYFVDSGLDWHVGVISTDIEHTDYMGKLQEARGMRWLDESTPDPVGTFTEMAPLYWGTSHQECGSQATWMAVEVEGDAYNAGFLREEAALHVVVISDENDHSTFPTVDEFVDWMLNLKPDPSLVSFNAIVGPDELCAASSESGTIYREIAARLGGFDFSICGEDWSPAMDMLGLMATSLGTEFFLSSLPVEDSIEVTVLDGATEVQFTDGDWTYSQTRNSITFQHYVPPELATVQIRYLDLAGMEAL